MLIVLFWIICGVIAGMIGSKKGEGPGAFFIGILFGPLGILFALVSSGNRKKCPACKELIHKEATRCPHCQKELEAP